MSNVIQCYDTGLCFANCSCHLEAESILRVCAHCLPLCLCAGMQLREIIMLLRALSLRQSWLVIQGLVQVDRDSRCLHYWSSMGVVPL